MHSQAVMLQIYCQWHMCTHENTGNSVDSSYILLTCQVQFPPEAPCLIVISVVNRETLGQDHSKCSLHLKACEAAGRA